MDFEKYNHLTNSTLLLLYKALKKPRLIEEKMLKLLRQGIISKWFSGIGQEAISVGATLALTNDEYVLPLHRNLGVFTSRNMSVEQLLHQWQGTKFGFTNGRDRSFHFGAPDFHIVGMISHLGAMLPVADGIALGHKLSSEKKITLVFSGDGGTSEGDFHEALNLAAVWNLPVIFLVENNGYGLSTPTSDQMKNLTIADRGLGYGIESKTIDGNNILEVYSEVQNIAKSIREHPKPFLLECKTFRMRGHEEASGTKYVPEDLMDSWSTKDPISNYEQYLLKKGIIDISAIQAIEQAIHEEINSAVKMLNTDYALSPSVTEELNDVYAQTKALALPLEDSIQNSSHKEIRFIDAIAQALDQAMELWPTLILMGQDIGAYGGVFKITDGLLDKYGEERVRNTPISESAPLGAALGLSIKGFKTMVEMQFADFVACGFNQIINNLAKTYYRWGQNADVVIRMPTGAGSAAGPFHSQSNEAWFFHTPGLKVVYPSSPEDAKGLLLSAFADPNPVLFFEHKNLYRSIKNNVAEQAYYTPIGKAKLVTTGSDLLIISYGWAVNWCFEYCTETDINATILDLRSLLPWDKIAVKEAVKQTGKVVIVHEDTLTGGIGAEIAAWVSENCFEYLDGPVVRVGSLDTPIPFNKQLEDQFLGKERLSEAIQKLLAY